MKKNILMLLTATFLAVGCGPQESPTEKAPIRVKTQVTSLEETSSSRMYVGKIEENEATAVSFTSMGVVKRVSVREGQYVTPGQLIAEMDDTQARNLLNGAEAAMIQANDAYDRYKMLHDKGSLTDAQWVEVQSKVAQAKAQLEVAQKNLADCRLTAPVSGVIGRRQISAGETALPSQSVVSILDIRQVKVKVAIPEMEINSIHPQTSTRIEVKAIEGHYQGGKIEKGVQADALTHTYDVRITADNTDGRLLPGMVANVQFGTTGTTHGNDILVPVTSVQRKVDGSLFVWTIDTDSRAHRSTVKVGDVHDNNITIVEGLDTGTRIVTEGYQKLSEGSKVVY